jgi:hypothetical protein
MTNFDSHLTGAEHKLLSSLDTPARIQAWLNSIPYSEDEFYRCPLRVLRDRKGHCFDGALFAAAALRRLGFPPLIVELLPDERDDDHLLAVFKHRGCWGAIAQSNFSGLRYREPIFRTVRELILSYFEDFFNTLGEKTLRGYRGPFNLSAFDRLDWMSSDAGLETLAHGMNRYRAISLITPEMAASLAPVDDRSLKAGLLGSNPDGLFKVH